MNRYHAASPRAAMLIAAVGMMAFTFGLSVLPAIADSHGRDARLEATLRGVPATDAVRRGDPIVVYGVRDQKTAFEPVRHNQRS
jgi:hypothetical protein